MFNNKKAIRDFIYLDIERVRSFQAQLSEGLTSERVMEKEREVGGVANIEGGFPFIAKAQGSSDYRFIKGSSETKSLHDYIFEEFNESLKRHSLVKLIQKQNFVWQTSSFKDGMFVMTSGEFQIVDYSAVSEVLKAAPEMVKLFAKVTNTNSAKSNDKHNSSTTKVQDTSKELAKMPLNDLASLVDKLMGDQIRIKVLPYLDEPSKALIGSADRGFFRYTPMILNQLYGSQVVADWQCLVQVNIGRKPRVVQPLVLPQDAKSFEGLAQGFIDMVTNYKSIAQSITFPEVAMTPIAIYRDAPIAIYREIQSE